MTDTDNALLPALLKHFAAPRMPLPSPAANSHSQFLKRYISYIYTMDDPMKKVIGVVKLYKEGFKQYREANEELNDENIQLKVD